MKTEKIFCYACHKSYATVMTIKSVASYLLDLSVDLPGELSQCSMHDDSTINIVVVIIIIIIAVSV